MPQSRQQGSRSRRSVCTQPKQPPDGHTVQWRLRLLLLRLLRLTLTFHPYSVLLAVRPMTRRWLGACSSFDGGSGAHPKFATLGAKGATRAATDQVRQTASYRRPEPRSPRGWKSSTVACRNQEEQQCTEEARYSPEGLWVLGQDLAWGVAQPNHNLEPNWLRIC